MLTQVTDFSTDSYTGHVIIEFMISLNVSRRQLGAENKSFESGVTRDEAMSLVARHDSLHRAFVDASTTLRYHADTFPVVVNNYVGKAFNAFVGSCSIASLSRVLPEYVMQSISNISSVSDFATMPTYVYRDMVCEIRSPDDDYRTKAQELLDRARDAFEIELDEGRRDASLDELIFCALKARIAIRQLGPSRSLANYYTNIERASSDLDRGTRTLKWEYASEEQRRTITGAYRFLSAALDGAYGSRMADVISAAKAIPRLSPDDAWRDFHNRPEETLSFLDAYASKRFVGGNREPSIPRRPFLALEVSTLLADYEKAKSELRGVIASSEVSALEEDVKLKAYDLVKREVTEHLRGIPVEDLNQGGKGYHVASLRRAGFDNLAAISAATVYKLRAVRGISINAARLIKHDCETYAAQIEPGIRIKLSADDKNDAATALVAGLYSIMASTEVKERCVEFLRRGSTIYDEVKHDLEYGGYDALSWLVWDDLRASKARAYHALGNGFDNEFELWRSQGVDAMKVALAPQPDKAWKAFESSPFEFYNLLEEIVPELIGGSGTYGLPEELAREIEDQDYFPEGLECTLRRYQEWGVKYALHQEKVLLGDEMGLGKTVQAIATMVSLRNTQETHFMVVCPASVLVNWCREISEKSKLKVTRVYGRDFAFSLRTWVRNGGVAVTTYETIARFDLPDGLTLGMLVVDEAHYVKNPNARRSKCVKKLCDSTERSLLMTGTALENKVGEMIALIRMLQPEVADRASTMASISSAPAFRDIVAPVYYRRRREDVLVEMPDLVESKVWCSLEGEELTAYELEVMNRNFMGSRRVSWNVRDISTSSSKAERMLEIIEDAEDDGRKVLVFSHNRKDLRDAGTQGHGPNKRFGSAAAQTGDHRRIRGRS